MCSEEFNRCYTFLRIYSVSWMQAQLDVCVHANMSLVSLHSKEEQDMLNMNMIYYMQKTSSAYIGKVYELTC